MLDKYLYSMCNPLKIKTSLLLLVVVIVLQADRAFRSSLIPLLRKVILLIEIRTIKSNRIL